MTCKHCDEPIERWGSHWRHVRSGHIGSRRPIRHNATPKEQA